MAGSKIDSGQSMCKEKLFCPPRSLFAVVVCSTQHGERERERERACVMKPTGRGGGGLLRDETEQRLREIL